MSKVAKAVGVIAGVVAVVATGGAALGLAGLGAIGSAAAAVAGVANLAATLTAKKPPAKGSITQTLIGANMPLPYMMGRTYSAGVEIHRRAWGPTLNKVPNPYLARTMVYSCAGPVDGVESYTADFVEVQTGGGGAATGYYSGKMHVNGNYGGRPEAAALASPFASEPDWGASYKLSGFLAAKWSLSFDKDGKVFASGVPALGLIGTGVMVYDPRLDSTRGGSGTHRVDDEDTWTYSNNPALHAATYAYGRWINDVLVFGVGQPAIDWATVADWANLCDDNGWTVSGTIFEPGDSWANLKLICEAGGAKPGFTGGVLTFTYSASRVSLDTITIDDLAEGDIDKPSCRSYAQRYNIGIPRYVSEAHKWEMVQSDPIEVSSYITADGEEKPLEISLSLVNDKDQAAQLTAYRVHDSREIEGFALHLKTRFYEYRVGDCLTVDIAEIGAPFDAVVTGRTPNPASMTVILEFEGETDAKHALALAATGTAPPDALIVTGEDRDFVQGTLANPSGYNTQMIRGAGIVPPVGNLSASDAGATATISVLAHEWDYPDQDTNVTRAAGSVTGLDFSTAYYVYFKDSTRAAGTVTYLATEDYTIATAGDDETHFIGSITTPADGGTDTDGTDWGGWAGGGFIP